MSDTVRIFSIEDIEPRQMKSERTGETFGFMRLLSAFAGIDNLLIWQETLVPRRRSSSPHSHSKKKEMILVMQGTLSVQHGDTFYDVPAGSAVSFLPDDKPHVTFNKSEDDVVVLGIATNPDDDVVRYADLTRGRTANPADVSID